METLFRFTLVRPPIAQDPANPSIPLAQDTQFQKSLTDAAQTERPRDALNRVARAFTAGHTFIGDPSATPLSAALAALANALDGLEALETVSHAEVVVAIEKAFGATPAALVQGQHLNSPHTDLRDSLLAIKQLPEEHGRPIEALTRQLRDLELIVKAAADDDFPASPLELRRYRRRSLQLPRALTVPPILSTRKQEEERRKKQAEADAERRKRLDELLDKRLRLGDAIKDLTGLGAEHFQSTPPQAHAGFIPPDSVRPLTVRTRQAGYAEKLSDVTLKQFQVALDRGNLVDPLKTQELAGAGSAAALSQTVLTAGGMLAGKPPFRPLPPGESGFRLKSTAAAALSERTRATLGHRLVTLSEQPLDRLVASLQDEVEAAGKEIETLHGSPVRRSVKRYGDTLVIIATPVASPWTATTTGLSPGSLPAMPPMESSIPLIRGNVRPAGIADLLVVKQQLVRYEPADIAHIENVLNGEKKVREHARRRETEELTLRESEITTTEERELESTGRFEMTRETNLTIREDAALKAGLTLSGKYGPTVEFSATAEGSTSRSREEAIKTASSFSQEVTQRSATKITERVLERAQLRVTNEVVEKNIHELSNTPGTGHISGVYQWVNKVYQAQVFNYGLRTILDFMVPEPGAFLIEALRTAQANALELQKPPEFPLKPQDITEDNHGYWVRIYAATDVSPPPEMYKTKSLDFHAGEGEEATDYNHSAQITIDEGYVAVQGSVGCAINVWEKDWSVEIVLGRRAHRFADGHSLVMITPLDGERDSLPFALNTNYVSDVAVAVEVKCQLTERAMTKWRYETHAKLTTAYRARLAEYEEKLAAIQVQAGVAIEGKHPALNLQLMRDELRKNCVSIMTSQHYDLFGAVHPSPSTGLPEIDLPEAEAEGTYVRFFEHAFEWEQMTWVTYPYFWGRKGEWPARLGYDDPDPLFNEFLKAGFCRVSVPVRPGFESAIDHYFDYGDLWNGGPLPTIGSDLYLPIADEIAERLDRPGDEVPEGEPWFVRVPTTLVRLRADDSLPTWTQNADGDWVPH